MKADMSPGLWDACAEGDLIAVATTITRLKSTEPSYVAPWSSMLNIATARDRVNVVKYCLENGAVVTDEIMRVVLINRTTDTYLAFLDAKEIDVNHFIPWYGDILSNVALEDDFDWARLCLSRGANPNESFVDEYKSVLAAVAELGSVEMAVLLIEQGARVRDSGAIVMAAEVGNLNLVKVLLEQGADIDEIGIEHPTDERYREDMGSALHRAIARGHESVVRFLIDSGADVNLKDMMGRTPLVLAQGKTAITKMLSGEWRDT